MTRDTTQTLRAESARAIMVSIAMKQAAFFALFCMLATSCQAPDTGAETDFRALRWAVIDSNDDFVGWLASPGEADLDHDYIFNQWPGAVYVTQFGLDSTGVGEWGFGLLADGPVIDTIGGLIRYTGPGCTGHPHGWIATYNNGGPVPAPHCTDQQLDALSGLGQIDWLYPSESAFDATMDQRWPNAMGSVVWPSAGGYHLLPRDQQWGEMLTTRSVITANGVCKNVNQISGCSVRLMDAFWSPPSPSPVYALVELEDAP
jgi:hypothetical protein